MHHLAASIGADGVIQSLVGMAGAASVRTHIGYDDVSAWSAVETHHLAASIGTDGVIQSLVDMADGTEIGAGAID